MKILKSGLSYAAVAAVIASLCAPQPAMAARYEMVVACQSVFKPNHKPAGHFETVTSLQKFVECTAGLVAESDTPGPDHVGPGIGPNGPEFDCASAPKERLRLQDRLHSLSEELDEINILLAGVSGDVYSAAQAEARYWQSEFDTALASCDAASNRMDRLVLRAAARRCNGREEVRERCIENLTRTTPALVAAQSDVTNACGNAEELDKKLTAARDVERTAGQAIISLWDRRADTYQAMQRTRRQLQHMSDWEEICTDTEQD